MYFYFCKFSYLSCNYGPQFKGLVLGVKKEIASCGIDENFPKQKNTKNRSNKFDKNPSHILKTIRIRN